MPLDDSAAEGPHSWIRRIQLHARRSNWPWAASTARLKQNLKDTEDLNFDLQGKWESFSCVLKPPGSRRMQAPMRLSRKVAEERFYTMSHCRFHDALGMALLPLDDGPPPGGGDDGGDNPGRANGGCMGW